MSKWPKFLFCVILLGSSSISAFGFYFLDSGMVHAATTNPLVMIVKDITKTSPCQLNVIVNIHTPHQQTYHPSCPDGTHLTTVLIPLSAALRHHLTYVTLPSSQATIIEKQHTEKEINALISHTRFSIQQSTHAQSILQRVLPLTNCGSAASISGGWEPGYNYSINLQGYLHFYRNYGQCSEVDVDKVEIVRTSGPTNYFNDIADNSGGGFIYPANKNGYACPSISSSWQTYTPSNGYTWSTSYGTHARWITQLQGSNTGCLLGYPEDSFDMGAMN